MTSGGGAVGRVLAPGPGYAVAHFFTGAATVRPALGPIAGGVFLDCLDVMVSLDGVAGGQIVTVGGAVSNSPGEVAAAIAGGRPLFTHGVNKQDGQAAGSVSAVTSAAGSFRLHIGTWLDTGTWWVNLVFVSFAAGVNAGVWVSLGTLRWVDDGAP